MAAQDYLILITFALKFEDVRPIFFLGWRKGVCGFVLIFMGEVFRSAFYFFVETPRAHTFLGNSVFSWFLQGNAYIKISRHLQPVPEARIFLYFWCYMHFHNACYAPAPGLALILVM